MQDSKILIVEDDPMISGMYKIRLEQDGFKVILADNGSTGLEVAIKDKPDLILLDIMMPQLDGFTVLKELRAKPAFKNLPIVMLTNLGTDEDKAKGEQFGATDYLVKANLTPTQVSEAVKKYLNDN